MVYIKRDYGIRPYIEEEPDDTAHVDRMKRPTWFHMLGNLKEKHSELIKPYDNPSYPEQEHFYPKPLFLGEYPGEMPTTEWYAGKEGTTFLPCFITCLGNGGDRSDCTKPIRCKYQIISDEGGKWDIYEYKGGFGNFDFISPEGGGFREIGFQEVENDLATNTGPKVTTLFEKPTDEGFWDASFKPTQSYANFDNFKTPKAQFVVAYHDPAGSTCHTGVDMYCTCQCPSGDFAFDDGSTPDTIAADSSILIYITGGCGPWNWSVSGTGYSVDEAVTSGRINTLSCVAGDCGVEFAKKATITVTDDCGDSVEFDILNTASEWTSNGYCDRCDHGITFDCNNVDDVNFNVYSGDNRWWISHSTPGRDACCDEVSDYWTIAGAYQCSGEPSAGACALSLPPCGSPDACGASNDLLDCSGMGGGRTIESMSRFYHYTLNCS